MRDVIPLPEPPGFWLRTLSSVLWPLWLFFMHVLEIKLRFLFWLSSKLRKTTPRWGERFYVPQASQLHDQSTKKIFWIHGASLGEGLMLVEVWLKFIRSLPAENRSRVKAVLTLQSRRGLQELRDYTKAKYKEKSPALTQVLPEMMQAPLDLPSSVQRFYNAIQPDTLIMAESEIWPVMIFKAIQQKKKIFWISAQLGGGGWSLWRLLMPAINKEIPQVMKKEASSPSDESKNYGNTRAGRSPYGVVRVAAATTADAWRFQNLFPGALTEVSGDWKLMQTETNVPVQGESIQYDWCMVSVHFEELKPLLKFWKSGGQKGFKVPARWILLLRYEDEEESFHKFCQQYQLPWKIEARKGLVIETCKHSVNVLVGGSLYPNIGIHNFREPLYCRVRTWVGEYYDLHREEVEKLLREGYLNLLDPSDTPPREKMWKPLSREFKETMGHYLENEKSKARDIRDRFFQDWQGLL